MIKTSVFALIFFLFCIFVFPQQITEESVVINIEVPVRVFDRGEFIDNLRMENFEIFEDGIPQKIEAVYLIKKKNVERSEEKKRFSPKTSRNFYIFFEINEYTPKLGNALEYFIQNVIYPDDYLTIVTPLKTYRMKGKSLELMPRNEIIKQMKDLLRKDSMMGNSEYSQVVRELESLSKSLAATISNDDTIKRSDESTFIGLENLSINEQLTYYEQLLSKLENLRRVEQQKLLEFADFLKDREGQKYVYMFYQREFIPQIEPNILTQYISMYQDDPSIQQTVAGLFDFFRRDVTFDLDLVKQTFADSSISIHFLFISTPTKQTYGIRFVEKSDDIFSAFKEMAQATGGFIDSSSNADSLFQKALKSSENYYLLYYSPLNYRTDGSFREIEVRVKGKEKNYKVSHRVGYFAN